MEDHMQAQAEAAARELLQRFKVEHPGWMDDRTPVDEIASWLGLTVTTFSAEDYIRGTYGWLEPGEDLIWICRSLSQQLRRFTLAHELGHVLLHRNFTIEKGSLSAEITAFTAEDQLHEELCQDVDVREEVTSSIEQQSEELLGIGQVYDPRSQRELAANIFAAELLMPLERLKTLYLVEQVPAYELASTFDVSQAVLLNRLAGLLKGAVERTPARTPPMVLPAKQYDEFQQAAIEAPTPALIVAGPGSGKTSTLIGRVAYLLKQNVQAKQILALTFSRKAAQEMWERLHHLLGNEAVVPQVSTFHAFCAELLRVHGERVGLRGDFTFVDEAEGYFLLRRLASELPLRHYQNLKSPALYFPALLSAISRAKDELVSPAAYRLLAERMLEQARSEEETEKAEKALEIAEIYAVYQAGLERQRDVDFGGLIMLAIQLLQENPEIRQEQQEKYRHILVDEFQDINRASGILLRLLAGEARRVWVVGDANQAIYGFRGASPANIANFKQDYAGAVILPLSRNYRSRPDIVSGADAFRWKQLESDPGSSAIARSSQPEAYVTLAVAANETSELNGLLADIQHKHFNGYAYRDIVVLCRTRAQGRKVTRALALAQLPVVERGGMLEQEHIKNLLSIVLLFADASGRGILRAARQKEHPLSQADIEAFLLEAQQRKTEPGRLIATHEALPLPSIEGRTSLKRLANILQELQRKRSIWELLVHYLFIETRHAQDLLCTIESKETSAMLADYADLLQLARYYDQRQQALQLQKEQEDKENSEAGAIAHIPIREQARGFLDYLNVLVTLGQDGSNRSGENEKNGEESLDAIRVMTVHASKGLEFPVVYLPGLVQRRFPMQKRSSAAPPPAGMLDSASESEYAHESGEACLFYVGATRARDQLVLSYSERYGKQSYKRSPYIDALVMGLPEERVRRIYWQESRGLPGLDEEVHERFPSSQPSESFILAMQAETLSASALDTYQTCPRRYAYSYIYRFQVEEGAYALFWQAMRNTLDALRKQGAAARLLTSLEAQELYIQQWRALGGHEFPFTGVYEQHGREMMESIGDALANEKEMGDAGQSFEVKVSGKTIRVDIDRVEVPAREGDPATLVRTSFGRRKEKPAASTRELLYTLGYRQQYPGRSYELQAHNLSTSEKVVVKLTEKREKTLYEELEKSIQSLESHQYPPWPDPFICPQCPFYLICPA